MPRRFALSHDAAFLAMLLDYCYAGEQQPEYVRRPCIAHPFHKVCSVKTNDLIVYAAAVNIILFRAKLRDAWSDERNIGALLATPVFAGAGRKAGRILEDFTKQADIYLERLASIERNNNSIDGQHPCSVDEAAEPFAQLLKEAVTCSGLCPEEKREPLATLGYNLGKWIYLIDAADDREQDRKRKLFNVYNARYGSRQCDECEHMTRELCLASCAEAWEAIKATVNSVKCNNQGEMGESAAASDIRRSQEGYIDNLIYIGLRATEERIERKLSTEEGHGNNDE